MHHATTAIAKYRSVTGNDYRVYAHMLCRWQLFVFESLCHYPFTQHCILLDGSDFEIHWWGTSRMHVSPVLGHTLAPGHERLV